MQNIFIVLGCAWYLTVPVWPVRAMAQSQKPPAVQKPSGTGGNGQLLVTAKEPGGSPLARPVTVTLRSPSNLISLKKKTSKNGEALFTGLPEGDYAVEVGGPGYRTVQQEASIGERGEMTTVEVTLVSEAGSESVPRAPSAPVLAPKALKEMEKGLQALQAKKLGEAEKHLQRALQIAPDAADANYLMGLLWLQREDAAQARGYLKKAVALAPKHAAAWLAVGELEFQQREYEQARVALQQSTSLNPDSWQAQWLLGACYFEQKEYGKAKEHAEAALRTGQEEAKGAQLLLGRSESALGEREAAVATLEQFLKEQPDAPQAPEVRELVEKLRIPNMPRPDATAAEKSATWDVASANEMEGASSALVPSIVPVTVANWAPPDVDEEKPNVEAGASCGLKEVTEAAGVHVEELVANINRYSATERMEHESLGPLGVRVSTEAKTYNYLASIEQSGSRKLKVQEYRDGSTSTEKFPAHLGMMGLPMVVLAFHPYYRDEYEFKCEGRGEWRGRPAWVVHYRQRDNPMNETHAWQANGETYWVRLKGRAWIDVESSQIVAMEADLVRPVPEIQLVRDYQMIEYGPVEFQKARKQLWLPKNADWYCEMKSQRYHRRHTFSHFVLFSVEEIQKVGKPGETKKR